MEECYFLINVGDISFTEKMDIKDNFDIIVLEDKPRDKEVLAVPFDNIDMVLDILNNCYNPQITVRATNQSLYNLCTGLFNKVVLCKNFNINNFKNIIKEFKISPHVFTRNLKGLI